MRTVSCHFHTDTHTHQKAITFLTQGAARKEGRHWKNSHTAHSPMTHKLHCNPANQSVSKTPPHPPFFLLSSFLPSFLWCRPLSHFTLSTCTQAMYSHTERHIDCTQHTQHTTQQNTTAQNGTNRKSIHPSMELRNEATRSWWWVPWPPLATRQDEENCCLPPPPSPPSTPSRLSRGTCTNEHTKVHRHTDTGQPFCCLALPLNACLCVRLWCICLSVCLSVCLSIYHDGREPHPPRALPLEVLPIPTEEVHHQPGYLIRIL